jgi:eukaryotic-like serine/threonine-protein kinase
MGRGDFVSVGETLAEARSRAGLSVDQLSERTKIRGTVIRCIEQDDYEACGGDVFVRGYVRALASAVGIDARPLIREYDKARTDTSGDTFAHVARVAYPVPPSGPAVPAADVPVTAADSAGTSDAAAADPRLPAADTAGPAGPVDPDVTSADLPAVSADPAVTLFDLPVVSEDPAPTVADLPVIPPGPAGPPPPVQRGDLPGNWTPVPPRTGGQRRDRSHDRRRDRRRVARVAVPAVLVLAAAAVAAGLALSSQSVPAGKNAAAVNQPSAHAAHAPVTSKPATPASAAPTPTATTPAPAQPAAITALPIASAAAFGPGGLADGDNTRIASYAITRGAPAPWQSQWYATPQFGNLKRGTGLLLDLGRTATVTSVRIDLASYGGANLQLRTGDSDGALSSLRVAAVADDVGGTVRLHLQAPERARYVLIWFTLLPPNGAGQYQASVYHVVVNGRP